MSAPHVVFMNIAATGHMNPTLPLVAELRSRGCHVSYFVDVSMRDVVESAGATWYPFRYTNGDQTGTLRTLDEFGIAKYVPEGTSPAEYKPMPNCLLYTAEAVLPALLQDLRSLEPRPSVIAYEPFIAFARVAAHVLNLPTVSLLTMPGPGVLTMLPEVWESKPWVEGPRQEMLTQYGFDVFSDGLLREFYSPTLNLVATIDELYAGPPAGEQSKRYGSFPFKCVGALVDPKVKRLTNANISISESHEDTLLADIDEARASGRRIVLLSLGTVATGPYFWNTPFATAGASNGLAECTGKMIVQHVFRTCFEALGGDDNILVVLAAGQNEDVWEGLPSTPNNFLVRKAVPQLEVLQRCDAFITHCGANSMHEALKYGVPMAVVPLFGDQPTNASSVANCGAGLAFLYPESSLTVSAMRSAMEALLDASDGNTFKEAACKMSVKLAAAGGLQTAADAILETLTRHGASKGGA